MAAERVAFVPSDLLAFNKRSVHLALEAMGMRNHLRMHTVLQALSHQVPSARKFMETFFPGPASPNAGVVSPADGFRFMNQRFGDYGAAPPPAVAQSRAAEMALAQEEPDKAKARL